MMSVRSMLAALLVVASSGAAFAADWVERPYNPPVGSRWIITAETTADETRSTGPRNMTMKARSELTIEGKTSDGFKIAFVNRSIEMDGNMPGLAIMREASAALNDIVIRATTDSSGRPVRVDNLDEAKAAMRKVVDRMTAAFAGKPAVAQVLEGMMNRMLMVDAAAAASTYIEYLPQLADGQQTRLKLGEVRRSVDEVPAPIGDMPIKSNIALQIVKADAASGKVSLLRTVAFDPAAIKEFTSTAAKKLLAAAGDKATASQLDIYFKQIEMSLDEHVELEVEDGMTRRLRDVTDTRASLMGQTFAKHEVKIVTVAPAQ